LGSTLGTKWLQGRKQNSVNTHIGRPVPRRIAVGIPSSHPLSSPDPRTRARQSGIQIEITVALICCIGSADTGSVHKPSPITTVTPIPNSKIISCACGASKTDDRAMQSNKQEPCLDIHIHHSEPFERLSPLSHHGLPQAAWNVQTQRMALQINGLSAPPSGRLPNSLIESQVNMVSNDLQCLASVCISTIHVHNGHHSSGH
jgi:hypothetical protein